MFYENVAMSIRLFLLSSVILKPMISVVAEVDQVPESSGKTSPHHQTNNDNSVNEPSL